jgi:hypothetical protein
MYVIIKNIKNKKSGKWLPVIILNSDNEVWEFESEKEADKMKEIFQTNSDSGHIYSVKKI